MGQVSESYYFYRIGMIYEKVTHYGSYFLEKQK